MDAITIASSPRLPTVIGMLFRPDLFTRNAEDAATAAGKTLEFTLEMIISSPGEKYLPGTAIETCIVLAAFGTKVVSSARAHGE